MPQTSTVSIKAVVSDAKTLSDGLERAIAYTTGIDRVLANGTSAGQANQQFTRRYTISASSNVDIDLAGALVNDFGDTLTFARIDAIIVQPAATNTNNVVVGGAASNQFVGPFGAATHTIAVRPGGAFAIMDGVGAGWTVTAGTGDLLRLANSGAGTSVTVDITIIGRTV